MEIENVPDAIRIIEHNLLNQKFSIRGWIFGKRENRQTKEIKNKLKALEGAFKYLRDHDYHEGKKKYFLEILSKLLSTLELYYQKHTKEEELKKMAHILNIDFSNTISEEELDKKIKMAANWFTGNSIFEKSKRITKEIDPEMTCIIPLGEGEFGFVIKVAYKGKHYALKISKKNNEIIQYSNPPTSTFNMKLIDEYERMVKFWHKGLHFIPEPIKFFDKAPAFLEESKIGKNAFLMEFISGEMINPRRIEFGESHTIQNMVREINKIGHSIPHDFLRNIMITKGLYKKLKLIDISAYGKIKHPEELSNFQEEILRPLYQD